jgi:N-acetylmuramoyl-L-alanine amidase
MAKINYKDKRTKWADQQGLCLVTCICLISIALRWDYSQPQAAVEESELPYSYLDFSYIIEEPIKASDLLAEQDLRCLVLNSYYEARNQDEEAIMGVVMVTLNRLKDRRYPNNVCDVIKQSKTDYRGRIILNQCQFSWYCDGKSDNPKDSVAYMRVQDITERALLLWNSNKDITHGATHYHANYVDPDWSYSLNKVTSIGDHVFYKWN